MLGLEIECKEVMNIKTFGSETSRIQTVDVITALIRPKEGNKINILFSTVPLIQYVNHCHTSLSHIPNNSTGFFLIWTW